MRLMTVGNKKGKLFEFCGHLLDDMTLAVKTMTMFLRIFLI